MAQLTSVTSQMATRAANVSIERVSVFENISQRICRVLTGKQPSTGFVVEDNYILIASQVLGVSGQVHRRDVLSPVEIVYREVKYTAEYALHLRLDGRSEGRFQLVSNLCLCRIKDRDFPRLPSCRLLTGELKLGEEVYFGEYSATHGALSVHKGMVSSLDETVRENRMGRVCFRIDGTSLPGSVGGPVFIEREGEQFLAGIMISDIEEDFLKVQEKLAPILSLSVQNVTLEQVLSTVVTTMFDHFSKGSVNTIHAKHLAKLVGEYKSQFSSKDPLFLEWYRDWMQGRKECLEIFKAVAAQKPKDQGRTVFLFGRAVGEKVLPEEEKALLEYFKQNVLNNPQHEFYQNRNPLEQFSQLKDKITQSLANSDYLPLPKVLKLNQDHWLQVLEVFLQELPSKKEEIQGLVQLIKKERLPDTRTFAF